MCDNDTVQLSLVVALATFRIVVSRDGASIEVWNEDDEFWDPIEGLDAEDTRAFIAGLIDARKMLAP